ncbi:hypothetical protein, partial [Sphingobacterium sp. UBA7249]
MPAAKRPRFSCPEAAPFPTFLLQISIPELFAACAFLLLSADFSPHCRPLRPSGQLPAKINRSSSQAVKGILKENKT